MVTPEPVIVAVDDLNPGEYYRFTIKRGYITGVFVAFESKGRGKAGLLIVSRPPSRETFAIPLTELVRITVARPPGSVSESAR